MTTAPRAARKVNLLPHGLGTLTRGLPPTSPETLFVLGNNGGVSVAPDIDFPLVFGRNELDVHVSVGTDDPHVSRRQGVITRRHSRWMLDNIGRLPIRMPGPRLVPGGGQTELPVGYTPLFIVAPHQEHLLQVRVVPRARPSGRDDGQEAVTRGRAVWELSPVERLVLICLSRRYLLPEPQPQPLTWEQVAAELSELRPDEVWTWRRAAHIVKKVRERLSPMVPGLRAEEVPPPVGNALNHNLIMELLVSATLTKADLAELEAG